MLRNSPYASMYDEKGGYQQYPMSGLPTNGGYNYYSTVNTMIWIKDIQC